VGSMALSKEILCKAENCIEFLFILRGNVLFQEKFKLIFYTKSEGKSKKIQEKYRNQSKSQNSKITIKI